jgi:hypothetical protein
LSFGTSSDSTPSPEELICAATQDGPARFVRLDLGEMTFALWSALFVSCFDGRNLVPAWFAPIALHCLGFGVMNARRTFPVEPPNGPRPPDRFQTMTLGLPSEPSVLVIKAAQDSVVDSLPPSPTRRVPGLALRREDLARGAMTEFLAQLGTLAGTGLFSQLAVEVQRANAEELTREEPIGPPILEQGAPRSFFSQKEFKDSQPPIRTVTTLDALIVATQRPS